MQPHTSPTWFLYFGTCSELPPPLKDRRIERLLVARQTFETTVGARIGCDDQIHRDLTTIEAKLIFIIDKGAVPIWELFGGNCGRRTSQITPFGRSPNLART